MIRRRRRRHHPLILAAGLLFVLMTATAVIHLLGWILAAAVIGAGAWYLGHRHGRTIPVQPRPKLVKAAVIPPADHQSADQIARLEQLAGRPMEAIIASYERIQGRYRTR